MSIEKFVNRSNGQTIIKDKDATLDYTIDWTNWLDLVSDTIASAIVVVDTGITVEATVIDTANKKVTVWLSGGTIGTTYAVACKITTNNAIPRIDERTFFVEIKDL